MLKIIQSNKIEILFDHLLALYCQPNPSWSVFEPFHVIVPSKVLGEWLKTQVADQTGISTLVTTEFWGRYFLGLMQRVLRTYERLASEKDVPRVPDVPMLSKNVMQWQIFGYLLQHAAQICRDDKHALHAFIQPLLQDKQANSTKDQPVSVPQAHQSATGTDWADNQSLLANTRTSDAAAHQSHDQRLWQFAGDMAAVLSRYLTYRTDWLMQWNNGQPLAIAQMIAERDDFFNRLNGRDANTADITPDWLVEHYQTLEAAQRFLWQTLFAQDFAIRQAIHAHFWQALHDKRDWVQRVCRAQLPSSVLLFTVQQLPPNELLEIERLAEFTNITLLHFNPSMQFWADIVDKNWLLQQQMTHQPNTELREYGHTLLSRFGKQSREVFAMLVSLSGNTYGEIEWQDKFDDRAPRDTLLSQLQYDILMLDERQAAERLHTLVQNTFNFESSNSHATQQKIQALQQLNSLRNSKYPTNTASNSNQQNAIAQLQQAGFSRNEAFDALLTKLQQEAQHNQQAWTPPTIDNSLAIHACHSTLRQLEVLRAMIVGWLNYTDLPKDAPRDKRSLSDILVLLPDIEAEQMLIEAMFPEGVGTDGYTLPAKVTGVTSQDINQFWQAIVGFYDLLNQAGARFGRLEVFDWLRLPPLYESFGLSLSQINRACELLTNAGFVRGFDEQHLQATLHTADDDYRYSFAYALERMVAGLLMPTAEVVQFGDYQNLSGHHEAVVPLAGVTLADAPIIAMLCDLYQRLHAKRGIGRQAQLIGVWLAEIEDTIQSVLKKFAQTKALLSIFAALNALRRNIEAHFKVIADPTQGDTQTELPLKLDFVLRSVAEQLASQQVSAEPAGVITFARIGAVRGVPYKLVAMLNLNLNDFPKREPLNRYDLTQATLGKRGDRFREADDLGAFLDALLCAREACWLFYNAKSTTDTHEHLPASPVQELLNFLQEVEFDTPTPDGKLDDSKNSLSSQIQSKTFGQQIEQYLVTYHQALPFDAQYFESSQSKQTGAEFSQIQLAKQTLAPPAKLWQQVYETLHQVKTQPNALAEIWTQQKLKQWLTAWQNWQQHMAHAQSADDIYTHYCDLSTVIQDVQDPAKAFLRAQSINWLKKYEAQNALEPLSSDNLMVYHLNDLLIKQLLADDDMSDNVVNASQHRAVYDALLPAGINRYLTLSEQQTQVKQGLQALIAHLTQAKDNNALADVLPMIRQHLTNASGALFTDQLRDWLTIKQETNIGRIDVPILDDDGMPSQHVQGYVLKAALPEDIQTAVWLHYSPKKRKAKHQLNFWLHHLCWQVARQTSNEQVAQQHGSALWQYRDGLVYLPPIECQQAYGYLQDWLMVWQLMQAQITILPPHVSQDYAKKRHDKPDEPNPKLDKWFDTYNTYEEPDYASYSLWQFLLGDDNTRAIAPFLQTLADVLYLPMIDHLKQA